MSVRRLRPSSWPLTSSAASMCWSTTPAMGTLPRSRTRPFRTSAPKLETNLFGVVNLTKAATPVMRRQGAGRILQFSSVGGRVGPIGRGAYAAAKWGVEGFSEVLLKEVGPFGIKVTIIEPGGFRTDFAGASTNIAPENPIYAATVGATARFQREYNGKQPGDPARAAAALMQIAGLE